MFEVLYLFVLVWAALPLIRTLMQGRGGDHIAFVHRLYRDAAYIAGCLASGSSSSRRRSASLWKTTGLRNWARAIAIGCRLNIAWQFSSWRC